MADTVDPAVRSRMMRAVRQKDTKPEIVVRRLMHCMGYRFRLAVRSLPGSPDIVLPRYRCAVFVHGCFWHRHEGCPRTTTPATRREFWERKFQANQARDRRVQDTLITLGWDVVVLWECWTRDLVKLEERLRGALPVEVV